MNESQTTIAHDSYDDQQEFPRASNHNEGNAIITGCIPDYNSVNKPPMLYQLQTLQMHMMKLQLGKMFCWCHTGKQGGTLSIK